MIRHPVVAGQFYPLDFDSLDKEIRKSFEGKFGPAALPISKRKGRVFGVIVPHAGYVFSGQCAAWAYKQIAESEKPDLFIILGTNHSGIGYSEFSISLKDFQTPFGIARVDKDFCRHLIEKSKAEHDEIPHENEHSIEVQLPFLQFVHSINDLKIVPILVSESELEEYKKFGKAIVETSKKLGKKICVVCSSDFTHYGPAYGYIPFEEHIKEKIEDLDLKAIKFITNFDTKGFLEYIEKTKATICGKSPIAVTIETCKELESKKVFLERYYTSGDIMQDYSNAVGYAAIVFK